MAKLRVTQHGQEIATLELKPGRDYFAGRGSTCDIHLNADRGISRQHIKFSATADGWRAELMSKYGGLIFSGESVQSADLQGQASFTVPPFEFHYDDTVEAAATVPTPSPEEVHASPEIPADVDQPNFEAPDQPGAEAAPEQSVVLEDNFSPSESTPERPASLTRAGGNLDATKAGVSTLVAYLKIRNLKTKTDEVLKLEGNCWTIGRHPSCEIALNDSAVSRKHFDLSHTAEGYFVTDHGSSNGTTVNGERIPAESPYRIVSGDVISVRHIEITFEIHDTAYSDKMANLPAHFESGPEEDDLDSYEESGSANYPAVIPSSNYPESNMMDMGHAAVMQMPAGFDNGTGPSQEDLKKKKFRFAIVVLTVLGLFGYLLSGDGGGDQTAKNAAGQQGSNEESSLRPAELSEEQKVLVRDTFNLAKNYYMQGKHESCLSQIEKLHGIIPYYENSKELENLCQQAIELERINQDRERKEQERVAVLNQIQSIVENCRLQMTPKTTTAEMESCLGPVFELDPQEASAQELLGLVRAREDQERDQLAKVANFNRRKSEGQAAFNAAKSTQQRGNLKQAIADYKKFLAGGFPGLNQEEDEANRQIAAIEKSLNEKLNERLSVCQSAFDKGDMRAAISACDEILKDEKGNSTATELRRRALSQLSRDMRALYQDSILEEGLGNVEAAKEKWQKILDSSVPREEYYQKAREKMKKYGAAF